MFREGTRVRYAATETAFLVQCKGTVLAHSPNGSVQLTDDPRDSLPVHWDDKGYYGVYKYNVVVIEDAPAWEV